MKKLLIPLLFLSSLVHAQVSSLSGAQQIDKYLRDRGGLGLSQAAITKADSIFFRTHSGSGGTGTAGADGNTILYGVGNPTNGFGINGNFYINTATYTFFGPKVNGAWPAGVSLRGSDGAAGAIGPPGQSGQTGQTGQAGIPGLDGKSILAGNGAPSSGIGTNGDFYFDRANVVFYGPKSGGAWPTGTNLAGPAGSPGAQGQQGVAGTNGLDGNTIQYGSVNPTSGIGVNGNFYINTSTLSIFGPKTGGAWPAGTSLIGPPGSGGSTPITNNLTTTSTGTALDAAQGKVVNDKVDAHINNSTVHVTTAERSTWNNKQDALGFIPLTISAFQSYTTSLASDLSSRVTTSALNSYTSAQATLDANQNTAIASKAPSLTLTTTGNGAATYANGVLNIPISTSGTSTSVTYPTTVATLQTAVDNMHSAGGGVVYFNSDIPVTTNSLMFVGHKNVTVDGMNKGRFICSTSQPAVEWHGVTVNTGIRNFSVINTMVSSTEQSRALIQTYYDASIDGLTIDHVSLYAKDLNINGISMTPYSPASVGGAGTGSQLLNVKVINNRADGLGRAFFELVSHVHDDGKDTILYRNFTFTGNVASNLGTQHTYFGPMASFSGIGQGIYAANNICTNLRFAGLEFVSCQDVLAENNYFYSTNTNTATNGFNAYSISKAGNLRPRNIRIRGGGGYATQRPYLAYDADLVQIDGGNWLSGQPADFRVQSGHYWGVTHKVLTNNANGGGQALTISDTDDFDIAYNRMFLMSATGPNYSLFQVTGDKAKTKNVSVRKNKLYRGAAGQNDKFINDDNLDPTVVIAPNNTTTNTLSEMN